MRRIPRFSISRRKDWEKQTGGHPPARHVRLTAQVGLPA
jgi:hypothetical protein